jgi:hypothetical protein
VRLVGKGTAALGVEIIGKRNTARAIGMLGSTNAAVATEELGVTGVLKVGGLRAPFAEDYTRAGPAMQPQRILTHGLTAAALLSAQLRDIIVRCNTGTATVRLWFANVAALLAATAS